MNKFYKIALIMLCPSFAMAQEEIETSPDQYETPSTVPKGMFQMENRFRLQNNGNGDRTFEIPSTNWKYGITDRLELLVTTTLYNDKVGDSIANGLQPLTLGLKVALWDEKRWVPDASLSAQMQLPKLASRELQASYLSPTLRLLFKNTITDNITLGYNAGAEWDGESAEADLFYTVSPKFKLSDAFETFIEAYGFVPRTEPAEHWLDAGLMYLITKNIQAEASGGYELTRQLGHHRVFGLLGLAFRI